MQALPGSATIIKTSVFGKPIYGDLDEDGDEDAALFIVFDPGGSGCFYYVAAALKQNGKYRGTNAVLLGDRIAAHDIAIQNGVITATYADRRPQEPMSAPCSVGQSMVLTVNAGNLSAIKPLAGGQQILEGWVSIGHEVRSFAPCPRKTDLCLLGDSPALDQITTAYRTALRPARPYTPLFMTLAGTLTAPPADGFGAGYPAAFLATQLVRVSPKGNCRSAYIVVDSPAPGALVASPLRVRGRARGIWFFEGDFPIVLKDIEGHVIAQGFASAVTNWMTDEFVPFEGSIAFKTTTACDRGMLILKKDNPTDRPELDDETALPVFFK
jgi:hypothetical protein